MKPVVSSLVALALAIAPLSAMAKLGVHHHKAAHAKVAKPKAEKADNAEKAEKIEKEEKGDKAPMVRVKAGKKDGAALKNVVHHAHNVDLGGAGHREPKADHGGALVPASLKAPASHGKAHTKASSTKETKESEMPRLPTPNAGKPSKGGAEKGARKPAAKKSDSSDDGAGEPTRDEDFAELVARIRGRHPTSTEKTSTEKTSTEKDEDLHEGNARDAKAAKSVSQRTPVPACAKDPVEIVRGPEVERFELTKCDGSVAPLAVEHLSILIRPGGAARPTTPIAELAKKPGAEIAHGIRRVDPRLVERIQSVVDHFGKPGAPAKLFVISGYRPASVGSMHSSGRAIDFRVEGVKNEDVIAFCKTLGDTGCGFYPNSSFVHIDVREAGAGHVTWIDASGPGETPRYVSVWPPPSTAERILRRASAKTTEELAEEGARILRARRPLDREAVTESVDDHPAEARGEE
ncbi:MAG TPA: DUF882 domain-containing protein [Labilithrix sp.]|nr:DUF882 domain-containing protein [Labilithrix sp.]